MMLMQFKLAITASSSQAMAASSFEFECIFLEFIKYIFEESDSQTMHSTNK